jgi:transcriptional regulator with XRE-family HTH domain
MADKEIGAKIRQLRNQRAITLDALTMRTGLSPGYLSKLERGLSSPPIATLSRIASALGVKLSDFFKDYERERNISIVPPLERKSVTRDGQVYGYYYESLAHKRYNKLMEPFIVTLYPKCDDRRMFVHHGEEMLFLLEGQIEMIYGDLHFKIVEPGTCIYIDASIPHRANNLGDIESKLLVIVSQTTEGEFDLKTHTENADG